MTNNSYDVIANTSSVIASEAKQSNTKDCHVANAPRSDEKQGYKETELGWIPEDWCNVPVLNNIKVIPGYAFDSKKFNENQKGMPLIRIRNLLNSITETYFDGEYDKTFLIKQNDVLIGMDGDFNIVKWKGVDALLNQRILKLEQIDNSELILDFIYYRLKSFLENIHKKTAATTVKHLSIKDINNAVFYAPPLPEQQKIAEILSTVDEKIDHIDKQIEQTEQLKKGLMQELLTKGIGHTEFKDSELGRIPACWDVEYTGSIAKIITGNKDTQNKIDDGIYPFYVRSNTIERINSYSFDGEAVLTSGDGVGVGKIFHYVNGKFDYHQRVYNIHNFDNRILGRFFFEYFRQNFYNRVSRLSAKNSVDSVRMEMISKMLIPLPPIEEQQKIAEILSTADEKLETLQNKKLEYEQLKKGLMQKLLTGQIRVNRCHCEE